MSPFPIYGTEDFSDPNSWNNITPVNNAPAPQEEDEQQPDSEIKQDSQGGWREQMAKSWLGTAAPDARPEDLKAGMDEVLRQFGVALLKAGLSPDYRHAGAAIGEGLANAAPTLRESVEKSTAKRAALEEMAQKDKLFEVNYKRARLALKSEELDDETRETLRQMAREDSKAYEDTFNEIIDDPDITDVQKAVFKRNFNAFLKIYHTTGKVEDFARVGNYLNDIGNAAGESEKVSFMALNQFKLKAKENGFDPDDPEQLRKFADTLREKFGLGVDLDKLQIQAAEFAKRQQPVIARTNEARARSAEAAAAVDEAGQGMVERGEAKPGGYVYDENTKGGPTAPGFNAAVNNLGGDGALAEVYNTGIVPNEVRPLFTQAGFVMDKQGKLDGPSRERFNRVAMNDTQALRGGMPKAGAPTEEPLPPQGEADVKRIIDNSKGKITRAQAIEIWKRGQQMIGVK